MARQYKKENDENFGSNESIVKNKSLSMWRPRSLVNLVTNPKKKNKRPMFESAQSNNYKGSALSLAYTEDKIKKVNTLFKDIMDGWNIMVTVVLVEVRGLPDAPVDGSSHEVYCKFRLGSETYKSKSIPTTKNPEWRERFQLRLYKDSNLHISLRDKGKLKTFMGSCILDLSTLEKERTHEVWRNLDDGYGFIHLSVTMCTVKNSPDVVPATPPQFNFNDDTITNHEQPPPSPSTPVNIGEGSNKFNTNSSSVGDLHVRLLGARGLPGRPCAYAVLEVDNERVQTHTDRGSQPSWNKSYTFNVYDVASTLVIKVYDKTINPLKYEALGRVTIPLLRINNGQLRWYALKDKTNRCIARGNCPRIQVEFNLNWNPVKAVVKFFEPKQVKYIKKPPKFNLTLVYSNMEFTRDIFDFLQILNEQYKHLFEWENTELSLGALVGWIFFWQVFQLWMGPLIMLLPFLYFGIYHNYGFQDSIECFRTFSKVEGFLNDSLEENAIKVAGSLHRLYEEKGFTNKINSIQYTTFKVSDGVDFIASITERIYNLVTFKVPILSYVAMALLCVTSLVFYIVPFNKLMILFGIYKFTRKYRNPQRKPNNDLLDFILRIPDSEILKDWKELPVPEPVTDNSRTIK